jgi:putative membrane protein
MNNQNIVAHLGAGDSLEVALSTAGAAAARDTAVRAFAQRMVTEHTAHMQMAMQSATEGGITPTPAPADTADAAVAMHVMSHLTSAMPGADYDKRLMRAQVMMHQHMLHDLTMLRPQASGTAQQLIDQTIPVVQQHLSDAKALLRMVDSTTGS